MGGSGRKAWFRGNAWEDYQKQGVTRRSNGAGGVTGLCNGPKIIQIIQYCIHYLSYPVVWPEKVHFCPRL
jgi:hypothetical protein